MCGETTQERKEKSRMKTEFDRTNAKAGRMKASNPSNAKMQMQIKLMFLDNLDLHPPGWGIEAGFFSRHPGEGVSHPSLEEEAWIEQTSAIMNLWVQSQRILVSKCISNFTKRNLALTFETQSIHKLISLQSITHKKILHHQSCMLKKHKLLRNFCFGFFF